MYKIINFFIACLLFVSCNSTSKNEKANDEGLVMYQPSEMTLLMRRMYEANKVVKTQIINKDTLMSFPEEFSTIHSAVLSDPSERDAEFDSLAKQYVNYQKLIFSSNLDSTAYHFNRSVNTCISCHETRCTGPIPKIKKLLIYSY